MNTASSLDQLLQQMPRELSPARDLWPDIAAGIAPRRWPMKLAAAVAIALLSSALTFAVLRRPPAGSAAPLPQDARLIAARAEMERDLDERLQLLAPATQQQIRTSLATIRQANEDIRRALAEDPASPTLLKLLSSTWQQETQLYSQVARSTAPTMRNL